MGRTDGSEPSRSEDATPIERSDSAGTEMAVVGVGNSIMGDDGLGKRVIEELETSGHGDQPEVTLSHAGTTAFFALEAMSGCEKAIVVDAIDTGDEPGTLHRYRYVDGEFTGPVPDVTMHDFSFVEALKAGTDAYDLPSEVLLIGVEPETIEPSLELSESIETRIPDIVQLIRNELPGGEDTNG